MKNILNVIINCNENKPLKSIDVDEYEQLK